METNNLIPLAYLFAAFVGLVLLFAQLKMFSINSNVEKILKMMEGEEKKKEESIKEKKKI